MANLTELTAQIITARATKKEMSTEEFQNEMQMVYSFLKGIETGDTPTVEPIAEEPKPQKINFKQFFKKDEVICLICNKGFKTLKRHLAKAHDLKPGEYRKQFNIPAKYTLVATTYSEQRKKDALDRGQGEILANARAAKAAMKVEVPVVAETVTTAPEIKVTAPVPAIKKKAQVPMVKEKAPVPAVKKKAGVPAVKVKAAVPAKVNKKNP